jgi:Icc-related predicted phosphoesterase
MRALLIADLQDRELELGELEDPSLELIISCGDVYSHTYREIRNRSALPILAVHGNHDEREWPEVGVVDLHGRAYTHGGTLFGGFQGAWRYKPRGHFLYEEEEVAAALRDFPPVDVFVAHNPAAGVHDIADGIHNGFAAFRKYIERCKPRFFLHGHSHRPGRSRVGETEVICVYHWLKVDL